MRVMSEEVKAVREGEGEVGRARPLSGGLWGLFSWLRRDERERSCSSDSLSSAGSDRTTGSFAFLAPPPPRARALAPPPSPLPPLAPPTDSYRKRVRDRHLQRQHDRDLTLHRKYGLYYGYDAFSLPPAHKRFADPADQRDRERRATSESLPRRAAHVPGKRRAPLPPRPHSVVSTASLTRRFSRKRPAPQPPIISLEKSKENIPFTEPDRTVNEMSSKSNSEMKPLSEANTTNGCKLEKYSKRNGKETKNRTEKSFLKQIFENKKRNSALEPVPERILPSISELDKQAAEIIELCRLKPLEQNNNQTEASSSQGQTWFCTRCLRKYDSTIVTCHYCLPEQKRLSTFGAVFAPSTSSNTYTQTEQKNTSNIATSHRASVIGDDEKQKLKEMLKEMKNSLPKRSENIHEQQSKSIFKFESDRNNVPSAETSTLRIGSHIHKEELVLKKHSDLPTVKETDATNSKAEAISNIDKILPRILPQLATQNVVITRHVVLMPPQTKDVNKVCGGKTGTSDSITGTKKQELPISRPNIELTTDDNTKQLHTPLKISSLLNPVYIPKYVPTNQDSARSIFFSQNDTKISNLRTENTAGPSTIVNPVRETKVNMNSDRAVTVPAHENKIKHNPDVDLKGKIGEKGDTKEYSISAVNTEKGKDMAKATTVSPIPSTSTDNLPDKMKLKQSNMVRFNVEQHSRRRELINQLEQSIAKGDERAAADAAAKLAQLRLSCSVLSFTSQIVADNSKTKTPPEEKEDSIPKKTMEVKHKACVPIFKPSSKIDTAVQLGAADSKNNRKSTEIVIIKSTENLQKNNPVTSSMSIVGNNKSKNNKMNEKPQKHESIQPSTSRQTEIGSSDNITTIQVWVEDREATRGPVRLRIPRQAVMGELRRQAEVSLGLAGALQRWIVGRSLCTDDRTPLVTLAGPDLSAPFYLCVVETETSNRNTRTNEKKLSENYNKAVSDVYSELVQLEQRALVVNTEPFECNVCMEECAVGAGAVLRECVHSFCRECLADLVRHSEEPLVSCPALGCPGILQEREVRALVTPEEYERWLARGLVAAESGNRNAFHCRTRDCTGWAFCDPGVTRFPCPVCEHTNCISCQAIHEGESCGKYQTKLRDATTSSQTDEGTETLLNTLIEKGEALKCPECSAIITKKWGCDWVKCSACKTEICWVTRGRRWGPAGKGDTSGGCRCGVDGKRCHPSCGYCH